MKERPAPKHAGGQQKSKQNEHPLAASPRSVENCDIVPCPTAVMAYGVRRAVVPQLLRRVVAPFLPPGAVLLRTFVDAAVCVAELKTQSAETAVQLTAQLPRLTKLNLSWGVGVDARTAALIATNTPLLETLSLMNCNGTDAIVFVVRQFATLRSLRVLDLSGIKTVDKGCFTALVESSTPVEELVLNKCSAAELHEIARLPELNTLSMNFSATAIERAGVACIGTMANLTSLSLAFCISGLDACAMASISELRELVELRLDFCPLPPGAVEALTLTKLETLSLSSKSIDDAALKAISRMAKLTSLYLHRCGRFTAEGLDSFANLTRLTTLEVGGVELDESCVEAISKLHRLEKLALFSTNVDDTSLGYLPALRRLTDLNLADCQKFGEEGLRHVSALSSLTSLDLCGCSGVDAAGLVYVARLPALRALCIEYCDGVAHGDRQARPKDDSEVGVRALTRIQSLVVRQHRKRA